MKIRNGFVSNSSSTSFTFLWKSKEKGLEPLFEMIKKYDHYFDLHFSYEPYYHITHEDVIDSIKGLGDLNKSEFSDCYHISLKEKIKKLDEEIKNNLKYIKEQEERKRKEDPKSGFLHGDYFYELIDDRKKELSKLKRMKKNGFTHCAVIGFGDNHGDVMGGEVGNTMDYEGRYIKIDTDDFVVYTEQNR